MCDFDVEPNTRIGWLPSVRRLMLENYFLRAQVEKCELILLSSMLLLVFKSTQNKDEMDLNRARGAWPDTRLVSGPVGAFLFWYVNL